MNMMLRAGAVWAILSSGVILTGGAPATAAEPSDATQACLECHAMATPGIVADWQKSRHAQSTPEEGLQQEKQQRRISASEVADELSGVSIGCAECHTMNAEAHPDSFEHNGYSVHTVVSPADCAVCHPTESDEFADNIMSHAYGNLVNNPVYAELTKQINGLFEYDGAKLINHGSDPLTEADSCLSCHGTEVKVIGTQSRETILGEMDFPQLSGWPNGGVGRLNPDGTTGACAACHMRHQFSMEVARTPYTCAQCHKGPDVPAYKVYSVSDHGKMQQAQDHSWDYSALPWTVGRDFTAPTCATCHISELVDENGETLATRTHRMNDRLPWRIFGLPYAHPHPISPDTTVIVNKDGLHLPTTLTGELAGEFLIDETEQDRRLATMKQVCAGCHSAQWTDGHFARFHRAIETTNNQTLQATRMLSQAWEQGLAAGPQQGGSPFDENIERMWTEQWLFYGNNTRFASAMGGADYGVFADGRWEESKNLHKIYDYLRLLQAAGDGVPAEPGKTPEK